jgi:hypothetical protein
LLPLKSNLCTQDHRTMWKFLVFLALLPICACTNQAPTTPEKKQSVELFVRYLEPEQSYRAEAVWLEGDSTLAKSKAFPKGVSFAQQNLQERSLNEDFIRHEGSFDGPYEDSAGFSFADQQGYQQKISPQLKSIGEFSIQMANDPDDDLVIKAQNSILSKEEELVVLITDAKSQSASVIVQGPTRQGDLMVPFPSFGALEKGKADLYLVKRLSRYQKIRNINVHLVAELYSKTVVVDLP